MKIHRACALNAVIAISVLALAVACGRKQDPQAAAQVPTVKVMQVVERNVPVFGEYVGQTESAKNVEVQARVEGFLEKIAFTEGSWVKQGALLFVIDQRPFEAELQKAKAQLARDEAALESATKSVELLRAKANLAQSEAQLVNAQQDLNRIRPLAKEEAVTPQELDAAVAKEKQAQALVEANRAAMAQTELLQQTDINTAKAAVQASRAAIRQAELNLSYTIIRAPISGYVGRNQPGIQVGALVGAQSKSLLTTISQVNPIYVNFSVTERAYLEYAKRYGQGNRRLPLELILEDGSVHPFEGRVNMAERTISSSTGTLTIRAEFPNPNRMLREGQFARVRALIDERTNALLAPQRALLELQGVTSLYVVGDDNKVQRRNVVAGAKTGEMFVVEQGLKAGERVIVDGVQKVRPDMTVKPTMLTEADLQPEAKAKQ